MEAHGPIAQHRDQMQKDTAAAEAGKGQHGSRKSHGAGWRSAMSRRLRADIAQMTAETITRGSPPGSTACGQDKRPLKASVPEVGFCAVRGPRDVYGSKNAVAAEDPVADLLADEELLLAVQMVHGL